MINVTFKAVYKVKQGRKMVDKVSEFMETHKSESDAKLRAMALNWQIVKIEQVTKWTLFKLAIAATEGLERIGYAMESVTGAVTLL